MVTGRRLGWSAAGALCLLLPVPLVRGGAPLEALIAALPAVVAAFAAPMRWPWGRITLGAAVITAAVLSLAVDLVYRGPKSYAALWEFAEAPALLVLAARQIRRAPARQAAVGGFLAALAFILLPLRFLHADPPVKGGAAVLVSAPALFVTVGVGGLALYLRAQEDRRHRAVAQARREQRLEVAGDLHDFVAHEITGIVLEVQAARVAEYDREQTAELLARLEDAGLRALDSMDRTVRTLRDPEGHAVADSPQPPEAYGDAGELPPTRLYGLADLAEMVERFGATGVRTALDLDDALSGTLPRATEDAVHRVVLEALTNIRRHAAGAERVSVEVAGAPAGDGPGDGRRVAVTVTDDGGGRPAGPLGLPRHGGGTGLAALTARVEALGGTLAYGRHGDGWRVHAVLPAT
ncbi:MULTISPECIES: sensor histidine kinase [Streptomyces]|uniref:histidine kinase n=1 Tax=Streptomyces rimosus subsp. rimosus TaxID=132474 RepID=A0ABY3Z0X1_STRRM|nr:MULTISPECIES: ATP-binding protein [Streptomyces]KOG80437.1 hypothetical protein ADK78_04760 [Kitasatospora aureofaciens]KEF06249.1 hypothetical protein DF17_15215 [Streptomyces rimosus]KUJ41246.1 hypothetical protein ADK46_07245 [Streptomyces rimosus subsp. rimosus]UNZ03966.1 sensory histidine kinase UhpB [Streptomyces rimosus subsp. rimosus]UTH95473.1 sensory histidine kinase UhpB [Streptomyces rimosus subsp. rimosus]